MTQADIGKQFNFWTIIDFSDDSKKAKCQCICGKIKDVNFYNLTHDKSKSCGCKRGMLRDYSKQSKDLTNQHFGHLLAIQPTKQRASDGSVIWECQCDCGNLAYVSSSRLLSNNTSSCGCINSPSLIGQTFGKLLVLDEARDKNNKKVWKCQCECGNITLVPTSRLRFGTTKSCGCLIKDSAQTTAKEKIKDLTGQRFGHLIVLEQAKNVSSKRIMWTCQCDCGNILDVRGTNLISGNSQSCGCSHYSKGEEKIKQLLLENNIQFIQHYRNNAFRFPDTNYLMEFDFFVNNEYFIEYDGQQHFEPIEKWGGEMAFIRNCKKDQFKNKLCQTLKIPLIRIPYFIPLDQLTIQDLIPKTSKYIN